MSKITDIRARQVVDCGSEELAAVINAVLGADFTLSRDGSFEIEPWGNGLTATGEAFSAFFAGRRFADMESVVACVMDCQLEQLGLAAADKAERPAFISAQDIQMPSNRESIAALLRTAAKIIEAGGRNDSASWRLADACMLFAMEAHANGSRSLPGVHKPTGLGSQLFDKAAWQKAIIKGES